ncbi:MAG TPA: VWA domain-containing protein [Vicinamibacterales bacterium]|jgi:VWFA-related protein
MRVYALLAAGLLIAQAQQPPSPPPATPPAAAQTPQPQRPVIRSGINFISVDVIVTDKKTGEVVLDMKPDDFEVREDRRPQKVESFDVVKIDELTRSYQPKEILNESDQELEAKKPDVRLFIMLLDDYHVRRGNDMVVRQPLVDFVNLLAPQDMMAIMYPLTPASALTFTRNKASLISAIEHFEGRKGDYLPRNEFEEKYAYYPTVQVESVRNDVTMGALRAAAAQLGSMREGRKQLVFVSEGFTANLPLQLSNPIAAMPGVGNTARPGQDVTDQRAQTEQFFTSVDLIDRLKDVYEMCNRNNTSIYAVDPRGLAVFEYDVSEGVSLQTDRTNLQSTTDSLRVLADNTDGRAIVNRNDLGKAMKQIIRDASGYYLLGYTSVTAPTDGKFHTIDVRVKRPNVEVRFRKGYWAYTTDDAARASAGPRTEAKPEVTNALNTIVDPAREHKARFWTGTDRGGNGQDLVTFVWEALPSKGGSTAARVQLTATAADGRPIFRGRIPDSDAPMVAPAPGNPDMPVAAELPAASASFNAPPGQIDLKIVVEDDSGQVIDSTTQSVTVPDYAQTQVSFSTPRVYRARTAREALQIRNYADARPITSREFSRGERLLVRLDAYATGGAKPEVTAKLLNRAGTSMADVPIQAADGKPYLIDFPLASLAAGEYIIEIDAKSASGTAQQMIGFRVGS